MRAFDVIRDKFSKPDTITSPEITKNNLYAAIKRNPENIRLIRNPSEDLQLLAVSTIAASLIHIINPTEKVKVTAINKLPSVIISMSYSDKLHVITRHDLNECKHNIVKHLLTLIKDSEFFELKEMLDILNKYKLKWPELLIIQNSLKN